MNARERVNASMAHREPDRVPLFELAFSTKHANAMLKKECFFPRSGGLNLKKILQYNQAGREERLQSIINGVNTQIEVYNKFGYDIMPLIPTEFIQPVNGSFGLFGSNYLLDVLIEDLGRNTWKVTGEDEFWSVFSYNDKSDVFYAVDDSIKRGGIDELARYVDKLESLSTELNQHTKDALIAIKTAVEHPLVKSGELYLLGHCDICMTGAEAGYEVFLEAFALEPELINRYFAVTTSGLLPILHEQLKLGVDGILAANDWCYKSGPIISPYCFDTLMAPYLKIIADITHTAGKPFIKHLDGNVSPILDTLIDKVGIDAIHSIEPSAGMDIFALKGKYGDRVSIWGNLDSGELMMNKTPSEVENYCKKLIQKCAPGGGYVMSTSNCIHDNIPLDNVYAMINACKKYGVYPICIS